MQVARPVVQPILISTSLKEQTYEALKRAITSMNIYAQPEAPKLDERHLAESLGVYLSCEKPRMRSSKS
jgi:DNA-binding GntR family transcriptional regulator